LRSPTLSTPSSAEALEQKEVHTLEIRKEIEIAAPIEITFQSVLDELGPESQMPNGESLSMKIEPWPGGRWYRDLGNNVGHLWGHVQVIKPPSLLEITGPMPMSFPAINHLQYRLKQENGTTRLTLVHSAMGLIPAEVREGMGDGWQHWLERMRDLAERKAHKSH
jgi:uncharacterized protein YndB with AHSA1/START domain